MCDASRAVAGLVAVGKKRPVPGHKTRRRVVHRCEAIPTPTAKRFRDWKAGGPVPVDRPLAGTSLLAWVRDLC